MIELEKYTIGTYNPHADDNSSTDFTRRIPTGLSDRQMERDAKKQNIKRMKKIMFNDKYNLTEDVLSGRKTMTRRIIPLNLFNATDWKAVSEGDYESVVDGDGYSTY